MTIEASGIDAAGYKLFEVFGVELEYMIVDADSLDVRPLTDQVLFEVAGEYLSEVELGNIAWSNELALHVIEMKTNGPAASLAPLADLFQSHVRRINRLLQPINARLMPTAMHPWMDPHRELKLWPHEYNPIYETYNRIFDCRGHGWANLQSVHLNLPFADDDEFGRLHAAIRLLLPVMPALAASSPVIDGQLTRVADNRMHFYRTNSIRVPSVTAAVIPEPVFTRADYEQQIFRRMYDDIRPLDPAGVLHHEWLNARGAIARFDRNAIEVRVLDVQECPQADVAICAAITQVLMTLVDQRWSSLAEQQSLSAEALSELFVSVIHEAERAVIKDAAFLAQFGMRAPMTAGELWQHLIRQNNYPQASAAALTIILDHGPLSRRIERRLEANPAELKATYRDLCECLAEGRLFI